jgi:hypothetical protein
MGVKRWKKKTEERSILKDALVKIYGLYAKEEKEVWNEDG